MWPGGGARRFTTTRWSLIVAAGGSSSRAASALTELCERYWYPVYAYIRRTGADTEDARDLTQAFFVRLLEKQFFKAATPDRGRFRSFLLASLRHFLSNERDSRLALKRGGEVTFVSPDFDDSERQFRLEPSVDPTPERIYERRWSLAVLDEALKHVASRYHTSARGALFTRLAPTLTGADRVSYAELSRELGMTEGALRVAAHRLRKDFAKALRMTVAETVEDAREVDEELRHLLDALHQ